jgi:hypothetical protein
MTTSILKDWIDTNSNDIAEMGFLAKWNGEHIGGSFSANLDSKQAIGTVTEWPTGNFEFHFNACSDGRVLILVQQKISSTIDFQDFFLSIYKELLSSL